MSLNNRRLFIKQAASLAVAFSASSMFNYAHDKEWGRMRVTPRISKPGYLICVD